MPKKINRFWEFKAISNSTEAELLLYGPISDYSWWGDEVTPKKFAEDLKDIGEVDKIIVRINSPGGDLFAAQAIYSMLRSNSAEIEVRIDGLAASAATVIAMVGETVIMPHNAMMMVHNPMTYAHGNAKELRKVADDLDKARESMIEVYKAKSELDEEKIIELLDAETWLTASDALEYGFIDEVDEGLEIAASLNADANFIVINGLEFDISNYQNRPKIKPMNKEGSNKTMPQNVMTVKSFEEQYPELHKQIKDEAYNAGVKAERERFTALKELDVPGCKEVKEIINKARYDTGQTVADISLEVIKAMKGQRTDVVAALVDDATPLAEIEPSPTPDGKDEDAERKTLASAMVSGVNKKRGAK